LSAGLGRLGLLAQLQRRLGLPNFHHHHRHQRTEGAAAGLLLQGGRTGATGKGDHQHRGPECLVGVGLGFRQDLHDEEGIADAASTAAIATPLGLKGLDRPTQLMGTVADGLISATGTPMGQQMNSLATAAACEQPALPPHTGPGAEGGGCRAEACGVCSAFSGKGQQFADVTAVGSL